MKFHIITTLLVLGLLPGTSAAAQEKGLYSGLKVRGGFQLGSPQEKLQPLLLGFGYELGYATDFGHFSCEAGFLYKPGRQYRHDLKTMPTNNGITPDLDWSVDSRKNQVHGFAVRFAYEKPFEGFALRGGIQLGGNAFRQEYVADVMDFDYTTRDTYNGVINQRGSGISPFVGVSVPVTPNQFFEVQLLGLSYTSAQYVHVMGVEVNTDGGHVSKDRVETKHRFLPHLEVAFGFRF